MFRSYCFFNCSFELSLQNSKRGKIFWAKATGSGGCVQEIRRCFDDRQTLAGPDGPDTCLDMWSLSPVCKMGVTEKRLYNVVVKMKMDWVNARYLAKSPEFGEHVTICYCYYSPWINHASQPRECLECRYRMLFLPIRDARRRPAKDGQKLTHLSSFDAHPS